MPQHVMVPLELLQAATAEADDVASQERRSKALAQLREYAAPLQAVETVRPVLALAESGVEDFSLFEAVASDSEFGLTDFRPCNLEDWAYFDPATEGAWKLWKAMATALYVKYGRTAAKPPVYAYAYVHKADTEEYLKTKPFILFARPDGSLPGPGAEYQDVHALVRLDAL